MIAFRALGFLVLSSRMNNLSRGTSASPFDVLLKITSGMAGVIALDYGAGVEWIVIFICAPPPASPFPPAFQSRPRAGRDAGAGGPSHPAAACSCAVRPRQSPPHW